MQTIFLEFKHQPGNLAANGSDITFYIDGRWSSDTAREKIYERVAELRELRGNKYRNQLFVGYTFAGGREGAIKFMADRNPPHWYPEFLQKSLGKSNA